MKKKIFLALLLCNYFHIKAMEEPLENIEITACTKIKYKDHANNEHIMYHASLRNGDNLICIKNLNTGTISSIHVLNGSRVGFHAEEHFYEKLKKYEREQPSRVVTRVIDLYKKVSRHMKD